MNRKEWREVGKQSLYFVLAVAGMARCWIGLLMRHGLAKASPSRAKSSSSSWACGC